MHLEQATGMDVDMGAHMWWSGWDLIDMAGLVDVPIAHHNYEKPFMREYIFQERRPELPHVHGAWAKQTKIPQHSEWKRDFIEIPGFPAGPKALHIGNHVRRDLLMVTDLPTWAEDPATFGPVTLYYVPRESAVCRASDKNFRPEKEPRDHDRGISSPRWPGENDLGYCTRI
jgi:hypothetical protein